MIRVLNPDGSVFTHVHSPKLLSLIPDYESVKDDLTLDAEDLAAYNRHQAVIAIRGQVEKRAGDNSSLLGTTADGAALSLSLLKQLADSLATAQNLAEVRAAAEPIAALLAPLDGEGVQLTCDLKGHENVVADVVERSAAVSAVLIEAQGEQA